VFAADIRLPNPQTAFSCAVFYGASFERVAAVLLGFFILFYFILPARELFVCSVVFACRLCINCGVRVPHIPHPGTVCAETINNVTYHIA